MHYKTAINHGQGLVPSGVITRKRVAVLRQTVSHALRAQQRQEIEAVKQERESLMATLAALRTDTGNAGGELQQDDISHLRRDLELKLQKLNELTQACGPPVPRTTPYCGLFACRCTQTMPLTLAPHVQAEKNQSYM